jgi:hypothetical protein
LEVSDQLVRGLEDVGTFLLVEMPMIALASLVVVPNYARSIHHVRQSIFGVVI